MRFLVCLILVVILVAGAVPALQAQDSEDAMVNQYLQSKTKEEVKKLGWASVHFRVDRINRNNDYNDFAITTSQQLDGGEISWLKQGYSFGADFGTILKKRFAWSFGGEYFLNLGTSLDGTYLYTPASGLPTSVENPSSEVKVWGIYTGLHYYVLNPPQVGREGLVDLAVRVGGTVGYYGVRWNLWSDYQNLNLATSTPAGGEDESFTGSAPGFSLDVGIDYPINFWNLGVGVDLSYLYLNFTNVGWYNSQDQEIIATYDGTEDGRVDLDLSGFRGKFEVKRFFSW
jgi:hypothetical protein